MAEKVKTFFHIFSQSLLPQPKYYRKILKADFWFSFKYFVVFIFLLNLLFFSLFFVTGLQPQSQPSLKEIISSLKTYPTSLSIEIRNGVLITNYNRPYFLWVQEGERRALLAVVSETSTPKNIQDFEDAPVILTNRDLVFVDNRDKTNPTIIPYGQMNLTVNKQTVNNWLTTFEKVAPFLTVLILLFVFVLGPLFSVAGTFVYLLIISLVCFFVFWLYSKKHSYTKTLQVSLHAVTLPYLVKYVMLAFGYNLNRVWPVFGFLVVIFILSALYEAYLDK